jgi:hypothetical protein
MRRIRTALIALVVAVVLTGCNIASKVVVHPDGSGTYSVTLTVPNGSGNPGQALLTAMQSAATKNRVPLHVSPVSGGGESGAKATFTFQSLSDLNSESAVLASSGGLGVVITRDAKGWHFTTASASGLIRPPGGTSPQNTGGPISGEAIAAIANISINVQLPGLPGVNNASRVDHSASSSTFTWALAPGKTNTGLQASTNFVGNQASVKLASGMTPIAPRTPAAVSAAGVSGSAMALIIGGAVVAMALVALVVSRRRRPNVATPVDGPPSDSTD